VGVIEKLWERLEVWGKANAPDMLLDLAPEASAEELRQLEGELGLSLPDSFKSSLAVHNGENDGWPCKVFANRGAYLSTSRIADEWKQRQKFDEDLEGDTDALIRDDIISVTGPVQAKMFLREWIPFLECNGDTFWAIDFSPASGGTPGQIIEVDWECCVWAVISPSFGQLFQDYVEDLESGRYIIHDGLPTIANP
jgi:cell wall assembly regulator SMI1